MIYDKFYFFFLILLGVLPFGGQGQSNPTLDTCGISYIDPQDNTGSDTTLQDTLVYTQFFEENDRARAFYVDLNAFGGQQVDRARVEALLPDGSSKPLGSLAFGNCIDCVEGFAFVHSDSLLVQEVSDPEIMMLWLESLNQPPYALPSNLQTLSGVGRISGVLPFCAVGWRIEYIVFSNPASTSTEFATHILCPEELVTCEVTSDIQIDCQQDSLFLTASIPNGCFSDQLSVSWTTPQGQIIDQANASLPLTGNLGFFYLTLQDECCTVVDSILVENPPFAEAGADPLICIGDAISLAGSGGSGHFWEIPGGGVLNDSIVVINDAQPAQAGDYVLHAFNEEGCEDTDTLRLTVQVPPVPDILVPPACIGDILQLSVQNDTAFAQITWLDPAGNPTPALFTNLQPGDFGQYSVRAADAFGCERTESFAVAGSAPPAFEFSFERSCDTTLVLLSPPVYQYSWETGEEGTTLSTTTGGLYRLTVTDAEGCGTVDSIDVPSPGAPEVVLEVEQPLCPNDRGYIGIIPVVANQPLIFSIDGGETYELSSEFDDLPPGNYPVVIQDEVGCLLTFDVIIEVPDTMGVNLNIDRLDLRPGTPVTLTAQTIGNIQLFQWLPGAIDTGEPTTEFIADRDLDVRLIVEDDRGCRASTGFPLTIVLGEIYVPNAFSPNADGANDRFTFYSDNGSGEIIERLRIYDRWGGLVFEDTEIPLNEPTRGWDGRRGDRPLKPGVYTYHGVVRFGNEARKVYYGPVTLMR